jgi:hypothetical protein
MNTSMTYPNGHGPNGATKIALLASHPKWCEVDSHQGMLNDLEVTQTLRASTGPWPGRVTSASSAKVTTR